MSTDKELLMQFEALNRGVDKFREGQARDRAKEILYEIEELDGKNRQEAYKRYAPKLAHELALSGRDAQEINQIVKQFQPKEYRNVGQATLNRNIELHGVDKGIEQTHKGIETRKKELTDFRINKMTKANRERKLNAWGTKSLSSATIGNIGTFNASIDSIDNLVAASKKEDGGSHVSQLSRIPGYNKVKAFADEQTGEGEFSNFYKNFEGMFNIYRKQITGAQASAAEIKMLKEGFLKIGSSPEAFEKYADRMKQVAIISRWREVKMASRYGANVKGYEDYELAAIDAQQRLAKFHEFDTDINAAGHRSGESEKRFQSLSGKAMAGQASGSGPESQGSKASSKTSTTSKPSSGILSYEVK